MSNPLSELIAGGEGGYNSYNRGTRAGNDGKRHIIPADKDVDFTHMTIAELLRYQALPPGDPGRIFAVGKYQIISPTMKDAISGINIDIYSNFDEAMQEKIFSDYLIKTKPGRYNIYAYIVSESDATLRDAQIAVSREWASVEDPDTPGHVYAPYERQGNKMHTTAAQVAAALDEMRAEYKAQIDKGLSAEEAWRATANMGPGQFAHIAKAHTVQPHTASNVLREGAYNPAVGELQTQLSHLGYTDARGRPLQPDNHFGPATRVAVETFQRDHGLVDDGAVGHATRGALSRAMQTVASANLDANIIRTLQTHLGTLSVTDMNQQAVAVTGIYDLSTRTAVARFQAEQGMPVTGHADEATRTVLQSRAFIADLQRSSDIGLSGNAQIDAPLVREEPAPIQATPATSRATRTHVREDALAADRDEEPRTRAMSAAEPTAIRSANDPRKLHAAHYAALKERFPQLSEEHLAAAMAAIHAAHIPPHKPLYEVNLLSNGTLRMLTDSPAHMTVRLDTTAPPPSIEQSIAHVQTYDACQAEMAQNYQAQMAHGHHGPTR